MTIKIILNPFSNRWNAQKRWAIAEAALKELNVAYDLSISEHKDHLPELTRQAIADGYTTIIAAGGDGTIGAIVNAMAHAVPMDKIPTLGVIPLGTANDFAYAFGLPFDLAASVKVLKDGKTKPIDLGQANDIYFANNSALGLEPYVTVIQNKIMWIKGIARYLVAAVMAIMDRPRWDVEMEWDGGSYTGPTSLVYVGNGPRSGGIFYMGPHAKLDDGKLTIVYGYRANRRGMFALLPKTMNPDKGSYVETEGMFEFDTSWLKVKLLNPSPAHTDGELFSFAATEVEYKIHPGKLNLIIP